MHNFKKLNVWMEAVNLVTDIYKHTRNFPNEEKFGLTSQINRSAISIPSNIAEGAGRNSQKEFSYFLNVANGSSFELETQFIIAKNLGYIQQNSLDELSNQIDKIQKMIFKLKKSFKK